MSDVSKKTWKRYKQASQRVNEAQNEKQNLKKKKIRPSSKCLKRHSKKSHFKNSNAVILKKTSSPLKKDFKDCHCQKMLLKCHQ